MSDEGLGDRRDEGRPLRVGVVNLMPRAETYESSLVSLFVDAGIAIEPVWLRLATHAYASSDPAHLAERYLSYANAAAERAFDAVVVTGAPVEHLPLSKVRYWEELRELLLDARVHAHGVLGLCWGALALGELEGLEKSLVPTKIFGVFSHTLRGRAATDFGLSDGAMRCPHSRFAGFSSSEVARGQRDGQVRLVADAGAAGPAILTSADGRVVMHLGHPEYEFARLAFEWQRDRAAGRTGVGPPQGVSTDAATRPWRSDSARFAVAWAVGVRSRRRGAR